MSDAAPIGVAARVPTAAMPRTHMLSRRHHSTLVGYDSPSLSGGLAVPDDVALWADRNKCTGEPTTTLQKGAVTCRTYEKCARGVQVTSCVVEGMGHCLPGMQKESSTNCLTKLVPLGMPNDDVNGVALATDFLLKY